MFLEKFGRIAVSFINLVSTFICMKASSSLDSEIEIELTDEEVSALQRGIVRGALKVRSEKPNQVFGTRDVEILVGIINKDSPALYISLKTFPQHTCIEGIKKYGFILSPDGYEILKEKGKVVDRPDSFGPCKVSIHKTNYWID